MSYSVHEVPAPIISTVNTDTISVTVSNTAGYLMMCSFTFCLKICFIVICPSFIFHRINCFQVRLVSSVVDFYIRLQPNTIQALSKNVSLIHDCIFKKMI